MQPKEVHLTHGSPLLVRVAPAAPSAATSLCLALASDCHMLAGQRRAFTVATYDAYGNACDVGGARIELIGTAVARGELQYTVSDLQSGKYQLHWTCAVAGDHSVRLTINGVPLCRADLPVDALLAGEHVAVHGVTTDEEERQLLLKVEPNALCPRRSQLCAEGLSRAIAGETATIHVHARYILPAIP